MTGVTAPDRRLRRAVLVALLAGGLCMPLAAAHRSLTAAPSVVANAQRFFIAQFQNYRLSSNLWDADKAFWVGNGFIRRLTYGDPATVKCCSGDRHYITTVRSDYMSSDWTYEITFHTLTKAPEEVLYIGFGEGVPDPLFFNEPRNSVYLAIEQGTTGSYDPWWTIRLSAHDVGMWSHTYLGSAGSVGGPTGGTFTARIRKIGSRVTFEIPGTEAEATIEDITTAAPFLANVPTHIFFGNALGNYTFSDMRVLPERPGYCF